MNLSALWDTWIAKPASEIQSELRRRGIGFDDVFDKSELVSRLVDYVFPDSQKEPKPPRPHSRHSTTHRPPQERRPSTGPITLDQLTSEDEVDRLSVIQLKQLLTSNKINITTMIERSELVSEVKRLWRCKHRSTTKTDANTASCGASKSDDKSCCCICMDAQINSTFVRCGHMATCYECGKNLRECPICRQPVEFTMRVYPT